MLVYLVTRPVVDDFRGFLQRHTALCALRVWTVRIVVPPHLPSMAERAEKVVREELTAPVRPATIDELRCTSSSVGRCPPTLSTARSRTSIATGARSSQPGSSCSIEPGGTMARPFLFRRGRLCSPTLSRLQQDESKVTP